MFGLAPHGLDLGFLGFGLLGLGLWSWASILRILIRRTSSILVLDHSSY